MPKTTPEKCRSALFHLHNGESICSVAKQLGLSKSTVNHISKSASTDVPKSKGGRPKKLQPCHVHFLDHYFELNSTSTVRKACQALQETFQVKACPTTVRKALQYCRYKARRLVKKPKLLKRHYIACCKFANEHKDMTVEDWKKVVWSDETKINFLGPDVKFGSSSIMIWGCMTWEGVGDNDPKHTSKKTTKWLKSNNIKVMYNCKVQDELLKRCEAEWAAITPETCRNLIESIPHHIEAVLKAKGGNTKY
ncbi:probable transposase [Ustilago sp. UG-2017b]|nr:probable transposase [Ustilago sp. UG-2017b]